MADGALVRLLNWFAANRGLLNDDVQVRYSQSRGYHVLAARDLHTSTVITCPLSLTLSWLNLDPTQAVVGKIDSPLKACLGAIPDHVLSTLVLVEQASLGQRSFWHPYIACLPRAGALSTPLYFADEDLKWLQGTNLAKATDERRQSWQAEWQTASAQLKDAGVGTSIYTWENYLWASTIFSSRAFTSANVFPDKPNFAILFPVIDILNHGPEAKVEWNFQPLTSFTLKILQDVNKGDEILNNYAPKQNDELLLGYGFTIPNHPFEQTSFKLQIPPEIQSEISTQHIPYGMPVDTFSPSTYSPTEPHFLRPGNHPLGRYTNMIPSLRGIPDLLVLITHLLILHKRGLSPDQVPLPNPGARIFVATIQQLTSIIQPTLLRIRSTTPSTKPENQKQRFAQIYREGQIDVLTRMLKELNGVIEPIVRLDGAVPPVGGCLVSSAEALALLKKEYPEAGEEFVEGVSAVLGLDASDPADIRENDCEDMVWMLWFVASLVLVLNQPNTSSQLHNTLQSFNTIYPLPSSNTAYSSAEDPSVSYIASLLDSAAPAFPDSIWTAIAAHPLKAEITAWASRIVNTEAFPRKSEKGVVYLIYMSAEKDADKDPEWMYRETVS